MEYELKTENNKNTEICGLNQLEYRKKLIML